MLYRIPKDTQAMDKALEIAYDLDDKWLIGLALFGAGWSAILNGDYEKARKLAKRNLNLYEEIGDMIGATTPDIILGHAALAFGEHEEAREYYLRCLRRSEKTGFYYSLQTASKYLGKVSISMGNTIDADRYLAQSLTIARDIGFVRDIVNLVYEFARLRVMQEEFEQAVELLSLVIQHPASQQKRWLEGRIRDSAKDLLSSIEDELAKEGYLAALERGRGLDLDETASDLLR
jgi:tetratricopeptide (TPR) repeat protein